MNILTCTHRSKQSQHPSQTPIQPNTPNKQTTNQQTNDTKKNQEYVDKIMKSREKIKW